MNVFEKMDERVKHWLMDCFDLVDGKVYREVMQDFVSLAKEAKSVLSAVTVLHVGIPATTAPWYEDATFSEKVWGALKDKYVSIEDCGDKMVATIIVMDKDGVDDIP